MLGIARVNTVDCGEKMNRIQKKVIHSGLVMHHLETGTKGPKLVITANIHGDECIGFAVVVSLLERLPSLLKKGEVVLYPSLNPTGLRRMMRTYPEDGQDLNRLFPGDSQGSASQRHVHTIWSSIENYKPDLLFDLHTDSPLSIPYVILDRKISTTVSNTVLEEMEHLARHSGLTIVWEYRTPDYRRYKLEKSLSGTALNRLGIPSLTLEVGPRRFMDRDSITIATEAVLSMMSARGMLNEEYQSSHQPVEGIWYRGNGPVTHHAGVFVASVCAGDRVERNQLLGKVYSSTGVELEEIRSHFPALVLSLPAQCWVRELQSCSTLALEVRPEP